MLQRLTAAVVCLLCATPALATKTWDGRHDTSKIDVTVVYFVPSDRQPLPDWRDRVDYFCRRIETFHRREFQSQSVMKATVHPEPLVSRSTTSELRRGDANRIFFRTLREADERLEFARQPGDSFPILLVLSEINWRPLDDFYRLHPEDGKFVFEGNFSRGQHFPGATSGGARATYLADRGVGWGLVSADGWRVPYRGTDCVVYHEGCGHTVGLPHPEPGNGSVMSQGQYRGWISESWLDKDQKERLQWRDEPAAADPTLELFTAFRAIPQPPQPQPGQPVALKLDWPAEANVKRLRVRYQTAVQGPWVEVEQQWEGTAPTTAQLASFDRPTPVSYRVDVELENGATNELWGYFQVRDEANTLPQPMTLSPDLASAVAASADTLAAAGALATPPGNAVDLLAELDPAKNWQTGNWTKEAGRLESPKAYGSRIEIPFQLPEAYRITAIVEPLDDPNGLLLGLRSGRQRFAALCNYRTDRATLSALENVAGENVGNATTFDGDLLKRNQLSQVVVTVKPSGVEMLVDGRRIIAWQGPADQLSLGEYWSTPNDQALFLGAYDCRYRFYRLTLEPL